MTYSNTINKDGYNKVSIYSMDKVVVFDLDETIGYFFQLSLFMEVLEMYYNVVFDNKSF